MSERILIVDDDTDALEVFKTRLAHGGFEVETAESAEEALARVASFAPRLVVTDIRMSGMSGLELLERLREGMEGLDVVVMTGHEDMDTAVTAMKSGAFDFLVKPVDPKQLQSLAERCFREQSLIEDEEASRDGEVVEPLPG
ncbi:MAG TPA: response regulator, partial [Longimicrobiales bacterium]|nr:response regulator [Longimicrobiales bacterium]